MLKVMDDDPRIPPYLYYFDQYRRCDDMLKWLVRRRLIGREFLLWARIHFGGSMLDIGRHILMSMDKETQHRPVLLGRDIV